VLTTIRGLSIARFFASSVLRLSATGLLLLAGTAEGAEVVTDSLELRPAAYESLESDGPTEIVEVRNGAPRSPFVGGFYERSKLTGDWLGARGALLNRGITLDISSTQFYQGVASGGVEQDFAFAGRNDYFLNVDGAKAGLWEGFYINMHGETRYGETINSDTGAIMPANTGALFPLPLGSVSALTGVKFTQILSENFLVFGGKLNMFDQVSQPFGGGRGIDAFMNLGLTFPIPLMRTVPYSTLGAGFAVLEQGHPIFSFMVLDTRNTPTVAGFDSLFNNGAVMLSALSIPVEPFGLPGHQTVGGSYSTGRYNNLEATSYYDPATGPVVNFGTVAGSWSVYYSADQALYVDPSNPKRSWGVFTNFGLADDGPSPVRWSAAAGLGGSSPWVSRPLDTFGIGYSFVDYSSPVRNLAPVLLPIGSDQAIELFYNIAVTPWCHLTPDFQVLLPTRERTLPPNAQNIDTAVVVGLRAKIDF
jgi:porin